jgi:hypothetical protein
MQWFPLNQSSKSHSPWRRSAWSGRKTRRWRDSAARHARDVRAKDLSARGSAAATQSRTRKRSSSASESSSAGAGVGARQRQQQRCLGWWCTTLAMDSWDQGGATAQPSVVRAWKAELTHPSTASDASSSRQTTSLDCYHFCQYRTKPSPPTIQGEREASKFPGAQTGHRCRSFVGRNLEK